MSTNHTYNEVAEIVQDFLQHSVYGNCQCITVQEAANLMGVEGDTIRAWIKAGKLPATQPGKEYLIQIVKLYQFIENHSTVKSIPIRKIKT
jgi:excisionase family DNA binding protein